MLKEFRDFAMRGNVMDLAVGVIIGGAFGKIVTSLVNDVLMPTVGLLLGNLDFDRTAPFQPRARRAARAARAPPFARARFAPAAYRHRRQTPWHLIARMYWEL